MAKPLQVTVGQYSDKGLKPVNQDFHAVAIPAEPLLSAKGVALALADGISTSEVSAVASQAAVKGFLADYFCTSEAWSVKKSVQRVLMATNSWLHAQNQQSQYRFDKDRGYVCTFSAIVVKSATAHLFHVGDTRIYRIVEQGLEQLTNDHRLWINAEQSYLSRALGVNPFLEIDYKSLAVTAGDLFLLVTDGVYEFLDDTTIRQIIIEHNSDLNVAAHALVAQALHCGSDDNVTAQLLRIDAVPLQNLEEHYQQLTELPFPPLLEARQVFDGYQIIRELHANSRSHVYLARDESSGVAVVIKTPSIELRTDPVYLERFLMEEWIANRINSPYVLKPCTPTRRRRFIYVVMEYIEGQTLSQWFSDHPTPELETVRTLIEQIAKGLRAFHRLEMLHQDLRPDNIMIDATGTVKIIDFGATQVAGVAEIEPLIYQHPLQGTAQYAAPEYFLGDSGTVRSDLFSLAVIAYQLLTGTLPYGAEVAKCKTWLEQSRLVYHPIHHSNRSVPVWVDKAIKKALEPNPLKRYADVSEFIFELRHPNPAYLHSRKTPLIERNPVAFWQGVSLVLAVVIVVLLVACRPE